MTEAKAVATFDEGAAFRNHPLISSAHAAGENRNTFEGFVRGFIGDLAPVGNVEATLAARAAGIAWRLNRAQKLETQILTQPGKYGERQSALADGLGSSHTREALDLASRWEQGLERSLFKTLDALEALRKRRAKGGNLDSSNQRYSKLAAIPAEREAKAIDFTGETTVPGDDGNPDVAP